MAKMSHKISPNRLGTMSADSSPAEAASNPFPAQIISLDRVYGVVVLKAAEGDADDDKWDVEEAGLRTDTENDVNVVLGWVTVVTGNVVVKAKMPEIVGSAVEDTGPV